MNTKILKRTILTISLLMMTNIGLAQRRQGPPPQPSGQQINKMIDELASELNLSSTQTAQITKLYSQHFDEMKSRKGKRSRSKRPDNSAMDSSRQEFETQIRQLLSPNQIESYDKFLQSHGPQSQAPKR